MVFIPFKICFTIPKTKPKTPYNLSFPNDSVISFGVEAPTSPTMATIVATLPPSFTAPTNESTINNSQFAHFFESQAAADYTPKQACVKAELDAFNDIVNTAFWTSYNYELACGCSPVQMHKKPPTTTFLELDYAVSQVERRYKYMLKVIENAGEDGELFVGELADIKKGWDEMGLSKKLEGWKQEGLPKRYEPLVWVLNRDIMVWTLEGGAPGMNTQQRMENERRVRLEKEKAYKEKGKTPSQEA